MFSLNAMLSALCQVFANRSSQPIPRIFPHSNFFILSSIFSLSTLFLPQTSPLKRPKAQPSHLLNFSPSIFLAFSLEPQALLPPTSNGRRPQFLQNLLGRIDRGVDVLIVVCRRQKEHFELGGRNVYSVLSHALIKFGK